MSDPSGPQIAIAVASVLAGVAAFGGLVLAILKWHDKGKAKLYRIAARSAVRSLLFARIELYAAHSISESESADLRAGDRLLTLLLHLDRALSEADDIIHKDVRHLRSELRAKNEEANIRPEDIVRTGESDKR